MAFWNVRSIRSSRSRSAWAVGHMSCSQYFRQAKRTWHPSEDSTRHNNKSLECWGGQVRAGAERVATLECEEIDKRLQPCVQQHFAGLKNHCYHHAKLADPLMLAAPELSTALLRSWFWLQSIFLSAFDVHDFLLPELLGCQRRMLSIEVVAALLFQIIRFLLRY